MHRREDAVEKMTFIVLQGKPAKFYYAIDHITPLIINELVRYSSHVVQCFSGDGRNAPPPPRLQSIALRFRGIK